MFVNARLDKVTTYPGFGVLLSRLMDHRRLDLADVAGRAEVQEADLRAVLEGDVPVSSSLVLRLAPVLGFHAADLLVMAGLEVPHELAPLDPGARPWVPQLVKDAAALQDDHRNQLRQLIQRLPQEWRTGAGLISSEFERYRLSAGSVVVCMLHNRNLNWTGAAKALLVLTGLVLSPATIGAVGRGQKELTPELLVGFAMTLGVSPEDLGAMFSIKVASRSKDAVVEDLARLVWDVSRLTVDQIRTICNEAKVMRQG